MTEERIIPFETGEGIFAGAEDTVVVLAVHAEWHFVYESEEEALHALTLLREKLSSGEPIAEKLRNAYSLDNLIEYLRQYLPRQGLIAFNRTAPLRVDCTNGVVELLPDGKTRPVNPEDVLDQNFTWRRVNEHKEAATPAGRYAVKTLDADPGWQSEGTAVIRDSENLDLWRNEGPPGE